MTEPDAKKRKTATSPVVMMNGLPGAMGVEIAQAVLRKGFGLAEMALTGPGMPAEVEVVEGSARVKVRLVGPGGDQRALLQEAKAKYGESLFIIDFTHPTAVNPNSELYNSVGIAFVMGTTGGDREKLMRTTETSGVYAVIAANMCKQIVALQATMAHMATSFPGAFNGYKMELIESHQKTKADTSGTAKDMVKSFNGLGLDFDVECIQKVRDDTASRLFGVPDSALSGHAYHTYRLTSGCGSVVFEFKHNVCGRRTYAEGAVDAVEFLAARKAAGEAKKVYSMIDVLATGAMR